MQAMILAAGFGTRLRPYSLFRPKPLFPVLNRPLLSTAVQRLKAGGFSKIIINCHHLAGQIEAVFADIPGVIIQREEQILGTGGGLRAALDKIDDQPLLVVNGDIYHTIDLGETYRSHLGSDNDVTMILHEFPRFNKVIVEDGRIVAFDNRGPVVPVGAAPKTLAYTGIQVVEPALLEPIKKETATCIIAYYRSLLPSGRRIYAKEVADCGWTDMGSPEDYLALHARLLLGEVDRWPEFGDPAANVLIDAQADCSEDLIVEDWACIGKAQIGAGAKLKRCVVWDGAQVMPGAEFTDQIII